MNATGRKIGRYPVEGVIGTGGFATVYRARDDRLDDVVAVKVLAENHSLDPQMRERFITEGCVLRRASDQNLVTVHDLGETDAGQPFLVLEYADRGDLGTRVHGLRRAGYRPDDDDVRSLVVALAGAVEALHRLSVVHRDLSPANLLLRSCPSVPTSGGARLLGGDDRLLLADLGMCKDLARHSGLTAGGGTDGYCAPEQRRGPCIVDARADLWSLSAIVVWLYTDRPPDPMGVWRKAMAANGAPAAMVEALGRGLAELPGDRPPTVASWKATVLGSLGGPVSGVAVGVAPAPSTGAARRRPAVKVISLLLVMLALVAGVAGSWRWLVVRADQATVTSPAGAGSVRSVATRGATSVAIVGPGAVVAGDAARFRAEVQGASRWVWLAPDGAVYPDARELVVNTVTPGEALVHLAAVATDGQMAEATLRLRVDPRTE